MTKMRSGERLPPRRTQRDRREATIAKLIDATIASILAKGYAGTTVKEICGRAQLSHGALFRFFPSVIDLVLAAGREVALRQITEFEERLARGTGRDDSIGEALRMLREACRSPTNAVFYELLIAARTDPKLRKALEDPTRQYYAKICESARKVPGLENTPDEVLDVALFTVIHLFDGESLTRIVLPRPNIEDRRLEMIRAVVGVLGITGPKLPGGGALGSPPRAPRAGRRRTRKERSS